MRLPRLSVIVATLAVIWCVAGWRMLGPQILLYPLAWSLVAGGFFAHSKLFPIQPSRRPKAGASAARDAANVADYAQASEKPSREVAAG